MVSDCRNSSKTERVGDTVPASVVVSRGCIDGGLLWRLLDDWWRDRGGAGSTKRGAQAGRHAARPTVAADTGDEQFEGGKRDPVAADALVEQQGRGADVDDPGVDAEPVIE